MKKARHEAVVIARHLQTFLQAYIPSQRTHSHHTVKAYRDALVLYLGFLETAKGIRPETLDGACFRRSLIEEWLQWLMTQRGCSPATCNNRLASLRAFLQYRHTMVYLTVMLLDATHEAIVYADMDDLIVVIGHVVSTWEDWSTGYHAPPAEGSSHARS